MNDNNNYDNGNYNNFNNNPYQQQGQYQTGYSGAPSGFEYIRSMLNNGDFEGAERELIAVDPNMRNAEWHYLIGTVSMHKGWLEDAYDHFRTASEMEPQNAEYKSMADKTAQQRKGGGSGYNSSKSSSVCDWCDCADLCECLIVSDCLCSICDSCNN